MSAIHTKVEMLESPKCQLQNLTTRLRGRHRAPESRPLEGRPGRDMTTAHLGRGFANRLAAREGGLAGFRPALLVRSVLEHGESQAAILTMFVLDLS